MKSYLVTYDDPDHGMVIVGLYNRKPTKKQLRKIFEKHFNEVFDTPIDDESIDGWLLLANIDKLTIENVP